MIDEFIATLEIERSIEIRLLEKYVDERDWTNAASQKQYIEGLDRALYHARYYADIEHEQPCGHPTSAIVSSGEGTHYCGECEREARGVPTYNPASTTS